MVWDFSAPPSEQNTPVGRTWASRRFGRSAATAGHACRHCGGAGGRQRRPNAARTLRSVKATGPGRKSGQLEAVHRDLHSKSRGTLQLLGRPCQFYARWERSDKRRGLARSRAYREASSGPLLPPPVLGRLSHLRAGRLVAQPLRGAAGAVRVPTRHCPGRRPPPRKFLTATQRPRVDDLGTMRAG